MIVKHLKPPRRELMALIDAVNFDTMARASDVEAPVPGRAHLERLRVEAVVPAAADELEPAFGVDWEVDFPGAPGPFVLLWVEVSGVEGELVRCNAYLGHIFIFDRIPYET